ncbi:type II toxin-antitoxin system RelB family antitoxin [Devosia sp.]|uniref:type II toxin-antitoxin system RelB family antitoxin n=1 Tax=Devosia sp. TaxID=1871048 RepID=UPI003BAA6283
MKQTAVRLPDETYERLQAMAEKTGRTATFYIREAIEAHLEDLEDVYMADAVLARREQGDARTVNLDELDSALGLDG